MGTTHVVRGEEWLPSLPMHLQLFQAMGWKPPKYLHTAQLMKIDPETGAKRKLSKRKDPELALSFYRQIGFPNVSVLEYLMTMLNSNYEEWRMANPNEPMQSFPFNTKKMGGSGALFDMDKLMDVSKNVISRMSARQVYEEVDSWAKENDPEFAALFSRDPEYSQAILNIGRGGKKPRKDIGLWQDVKPYMAFFFDELFTPDYSQMPALDRQMIDQILTDYQSVYDPEDDGTVWFNKLKEMCPKYRLCSDMKAYKKDPEDYAGSVADLSMVLRVAITGRAQSPDLAQVCALLGKERVMRRLKQAIERE